MEGSTKTRNLNLAILPLAVASVGIIQWGRTQDGVVALMLMGVAGLAAISYVFISTWLRRVSGWSLAFSWLAQLLTFAMYTALFALLLSIGIGQGFDEALPIMLLGAGIGAVVYGLFLDKPSS